MIYVMFKRAREVDCLSFYSWLIWYRLNDRAGKELEYLQAIHVRGCDNDGDELRELS